MFYNRLFLWRNNPEGAAMATLTQLEYLVAVDDTKSFSRAAKACHVSQPSLSTQVQKLEDELDIIVFDRSKKPIMTTVKGGEVIAQAKEVLRQYRRVFDIKNDSGVLTGTLQLAVIPSLASYVVPLFVRRFAERYPKVNLSITEVKTDTIVEQLYDDIIDVGLLVTPLYDDKLIERLLFYERFKVFAAKGHPLTAKRNVTDSDLDGEPVWLLEEGHCFRDQVVRVCSRAKRQNVLDNVEFASGSLETLINLIRKGDGYTLIPELAAMNLSEQDKAVHLRNFKKPIPTREVSLVHSRSFLKQELIDALEAEIIAALPRGIKSLKKGNLSVIDI